MWYFWGNFLEKIVTFWGKNLLLFNSTSGHNVHGAVKLYWTGPKFCSQGRRRRRRAVNWSLRCKLISKTNHFQPRLTLSRLSVRLTGLIYQTGFEGKLDWNARAAKFSNEIISIGRNQWSEWNFNWLRESSGNRVTTDPKLSSVVQQDVCARGSFQTEFSSGWTRLK